jgi:hypothetical protein
MSAVPSQPEGLASILRELVDLSRGSANDGFRERKEELRPSTKSGAAGSDDAMKSRALEGPESGTA